MVFYSWSTCVCGARAAFKNRNGKPTSNRHRRRRRWQNGRTTHSFKASSGHNLLYLSREHRAQKSPPQNRHKIYIIYSSRVLCEAHVMLGTYIFAHAEPSCIQQVHNTLYSTPLHTRHANKTHRATQTQTEHTIHNQIECSHSCVVSLCVVFSWDSSSQSATDGRLLAAAAAGPLPVVSSFTCAHCGVCGVCVCCGCGVGGDGGSDFDAR